MDLINNPELIKQGAEARLFKGEFLGREVALKERFRKSYRHPILDEKITKKRVKEEARFLARADRLGICVPGVLYVDLESGCVIMEWINGIAVKEIINGNYKLKETDLKISAIVNSIGRSIARLHEANIIHGDLTTSNMLYDLDTKEIVFIDFGLSYMASGSVANEDKAVDLNVLERVFSSSHPKQFQLYREILDTYEKETKGSKGVLKRLEEVRMRGRKRDMVG